MELVSPSSSRRAGAVDKIVSTLAARGRNIVCWKAGVALLIFITFALVLPTQYLNRPLSCKYPPPPLHGTQLCQNQNECRAKCMPGFVRARGDTTIRCSMSPRGTPVWSGRPLICIPEADAERIPLGAVAASSSSSAFWLLVGACIFASLLFVVGLGVKLAWAVRDARHRDQMEAVRTELQRRAYLGVFFSPDGKSLPGILAEMGTLQDGDDTEVCLLAKASLARLKTAVPNLQPAMVIIGLHGSQNGLYQLSDGLATSIQIRDALYPSSRLRIVVLNTCYSESLGLDISLGIPQSYVICFPTICSDECCNIFTRALHEAEQEMVSEPGVDVFSVDVPVLFQRAVHRAFRAGFRYGDPEPYLRKYHSDPNVQRDHATRPGGDVHCRGCYPPKHGEVVLLHQGRRWSSLDIIPPETQLELIA